ncbi:hypothetical protein HYQ45_014080 [Verticillium longisporum]|uniref:Brl1/Brr6 domain-containing protein n=1 Tax=Verticillium longisporum TaxID=100787 RepID=A0A8I2ZCX6_VERLO|nr:hypothetical protein HYQ45_014080 [Verticillium longisporum]
MDRRTYESPMEWEYQDQRGPLDATSPFSHVAKSQATRIDFSSPSKFSSSRPNPFASSPSKPLPPLPQTSLFSPRIQHSSTAPPFRNPAFTTPRKPFDETLFSEAESSPALTEASDLPNDTPDVDRTTDLTMGGMSPSRINKNLRYARSPGQHLKRHMPGKGEISRAHRDHAGALRKRKRHNYDRDVGNVRYDSSRETSASDSEDEDEYQRQKQGVKGSKKKSGASKGWFETIVQTINQNPNMPDNLAKWMTFFVNAGVVSVFLYFGWSLFSTVSTDIANAHDAARRDIVTKALECNNQYILNGCEKKDRPALKAMCDEWDECRIQDPESIMRVKNTAKQVAEVINEFAGTMSLHAWFFFFGILLLCLGLNAWSHVQIGTSAKAVHPVPSNAAADVGHHPQPSGFPGDSAQAYMWVPIQTPSHRRQLDFDADGTDTDGASPPFRKAILPPPQTPSRRSPSKGDYSRSPVKYGRSPSKGY